jgi:hypothetical protein
MGSTHCKAMQVQGRSVHPFSETPLGVGPCPCEAYGMQGRVRRPPVLDARVYKSKANEGASSTRVWRYG